MSGAHVVVWMFRVRRFLVFVVFLYLGQNFVFFFFPIVVYLFVVFIKSISV